VAKELVTMSKLPESAGKTFPLANAKLVRLRDVYHAIRSTGYELDELEPPQWLARMAEHSARTGEDGMAILARLIPRAAGLDELLTEFGQSSPDPSIQISRSARLPQRVSANCPEVDERVLARHLKYLTDKGVLTPPSERARPSIQFAGFAKSPRNAGNPL
jgi:hypothetical protein